MEKKISISLCMIVKNEEKTLPRCLTSVKEFVDEIIVVDTGSQDSTKDIAKKFKAKVYDFKWIDDFSKARNYAFSKATKDYIFWLDADDYIDNENIRKLIELKEVLDFEIDSVTMNYSLTRDENGKTIFSLRRNRLVKREKNFKWTGRVHEFLEVYGKQYNPEITINHDKRKEYTDRNIRIFREMEDNNEEFSIRDLFYFANELYYSDFFDEAIEKYEKFLDTNLGWIEDRKTATRNLIHCYDIKGKSGKNIGTILKSFEYDIPRADLCCKLAEIFLKSQQYTQAIFWYKVAMGCKHEKDNLGMDLKEYYTWIPAIQLCVCYNAIGEDEVAYYYNELTAIYVPDSPKVKYNREYFKKVFGKMHKELPKVYLDVTDLRYRHL